MTPEAITPVVAEQPQWNDEAPWDNGRTLETFISSPVIDQQGDMIPTDAWPKILPPLMKFGNYTWYHTDLPIGKFIGWRIRDNKPEVRVGIFDSKSTGIPYHDKAWDIIKKFGMKGTSSIKGVPKEKSLVCIGDECFRKIKDIGVWAVGWVADQPANPGAVVTGIAKEMFNGNVTYNDVIMIDAMEKAMGITEPVTFTVDVNDKMIEAVLKNSTDLGDMIQKCPSCLRTVIDMMESGISKVSAIDTVKNQLITEILSKPFAGFKNFDECVAANADKDDPKAYCATIMQTVEGKSAIIDGHTPDGDDIKRGVQMEPSNTPAPSGATTVPKIEDIVASVAEMQGRIDEMAKTIASMTTPATPAQVAAPPVVDTIKSAPTVTKDDIEAIVKSAIKSLDDRMASIEGKIGEPAVSKRGKAPTNDANAKAFDLMTASPAEIAAAFGRK